MAGGLFGRPFAFNEKCIVFSILCMSLFLYKPKFKNNYWLYFILALHCTGFNDNTRNILSGFCSHYERNNNYKINNYKVYNENIFLRNNKSKWKQFEQAWKSFL